MITIIKEEWKKIYLDKEKTKYSISNFGNVRNDKSNKLLKPQKDKKGYMRIQLHHNKKVYTKKVNRLVAKAFLQRTFHKKQVNHKDGIKDNNLVYNLEWVTNSKNQLHAYKMGLNKQKCGEEHHNNKYKTEFIIKICELLEKRYTTTEIKKCLNIKTSNSSVTYLIHDIKKKGKWKHISKNYNL